MKTTVDLPDSLLIAAKKRAAELRRPLRSLIEAGLRAQLRVARRPTSSPQRRIRWVTVAGGLPQGLDVSDREQMYAWLSKTR